MPRVCWVANTIHLASVELLLGQRLHRWASLIPASATGSRPTKPPLANIVQQSGSRARFDVDFTSNYQAFLGCAINPLGATVS